MRAHGGKCNSRVADCSRGEKSISSKRPADLDEIIHQPLRLKIMAALNALPAEVGLEFVRLKKLTGATDGNLGAHIENLGQGGLCLGGEGVCGEEAADYGDRHRRRPRCVRTACGDVAGDHCREAGVAFEKVLSR
ncbi:hypothetical protein GA0061099_1006166 [Bradyrhizobium yuanmingense]|uniref:Transcriptional regulator n=1 Tax=Bradyrhizobium yuanmingense TaxID=108015 RepID=A0A1C3WHV9_9BRAD|nr:hypothetical protein IQ15_04595 [Bradyrhizobium yuanmingense]SCB39530.1 hypothetical protein GA0061099_1006166 [Bradyrhizobium yuanmingense]